MGETLYGVSRSVEGWKVHIALSAADLDRLARGDTIERSLDDPDSPDDAIERCHETDASGMSYDVTKVTINRLP